MGRLAGPGGLLLSLLRKLRMPLKLEMLWLIQSLMGRRSVLTSVLQSEPTPPHLVSTWADLLGPATAEVVAEIVIGETDTGDRPVHITDADHPHHAPDTDTELDQEATLHVVITETRGWECFA